MMLVFLFFCFFFFFFSSRRRHTRYWRDWSSDVCSSDLISCAGAANLHPSGTPDSPGDHFLGVSLLAMRHERHGRAREGDDRLLEATSRRRPVSAPLAGAKCLHWGPLDRERTLMGIWDDCAPQSGLDVPK